MQRDARSRQRLVARAATQIESGTDGLTHLFPSPAALADADLGGIGITGARIRALRALSRAVDDGTVDFEAPVEEVTEALAALPGLGHWTAQYVALRALAEPDAFPAADIVLRRMAAAGQDRSQRVHWKHVPRNGDRGAVTRCCICGPRRPKLA